MRVTLDGALSAPSARLAAARHQAGHAVARGGREREPRDARVTGEFSVSRVHVGSRLAHRSPQPHRSRNVGTPSPRRLTFPGFGLKVLNVGRTNAVRGAGRCNSDASHRHCGPRSLHRRRTKTLFNLRASFIKRECYARQHGYANVFATHAPEPYGSVLFSRVLLGVEWLPHFEWLLITDADYFLNNFSAQSLHRRFDATRNRHHGATLRLSLRLHPTPAGRLPLLCHPRAQHSPLGRELLETWAQLRHSCQQAVQWPEQQRLFLSAARAVQRYHGLPTTPESDCTRECDAPPAGNRSVTHRQTEREQSTDTTQQRIVKKCFANITRHLGLRTGHDGASGFPPQPPVAWSNGECRRADAGLGISLNFGALRRNGSDYAEAITNALALHT
jgi:hypothetical protein